MRVVVERQLIAAVEREPLVVVVVARRNPAAVGGAAFAARREATAEGPSLAQAAIAQAIAHAPAVVATAAARRATTVAAPGFATAGCRRFAPAVCSRRGVRLRRFFSRRRSGRPTRCRRSRGRRSRGLVLQIVVERRLDRRLRMRRGGTIGQYGQSYGPSYHAHVWCSFSDIAPRPGGPPDRAAT